MEKDFNSFIFQLCETNKTLGFFVDFNKVTLNLEKISVKLNQLNYLLGKENIRDAIEILYKENPKCFNVLNILIAARNKKEKVMRATEDRQAVNLDYFFDSSDKVYEFINKTGLEIVFKNKNISNIHDYVFGIEVGLDSNARKNRVGKIMEQTIRTHLMYYQIKFKEQISCKKLPTALSNALGKDIKVFDFLIRTKKNTYLIETNFYNGGGSKLNEVSRAYMRTNEAIEQVDSYKFVWITDGAGWLSAKNKLQEAYNQIEHVYNLQTLGDFINRIRIEGVIDPE